MNRSDTADVAEASEARAASPKPKAAAKRKSATKTPPKLRREQSSILFPYRDLEVGISVAQAMIGAGGVPLTTDQLAGVMGLQAGSGNFVMKVATARIFGLVTNADGRYKLTDTGFAIVDKDDLRQRSARAEAFLKVPLYRRTYEEFRGRQLPLPRPHALEQAFVHFGVSNKQKEAARLAFDRSANQAGFFAAGQDRLIEPIIGGAPPIRPPVADDDDGGNGGRRPSGESPAPSGRDLPPFIQGLLDSLPEPNTNWAVEGRAKWLTAAANCFDLMYKGSGEITITAKLTPEPQK